MTDIEKFIKKIYYENPKKLWFLKNIIFKFVTHNNWF